MKTEKNPEKRGNREIKKENGEPRRQSKEREKKEERKGRSDIERLAVT